MPKYVGMPIHLPFKWPVSAEDFGEMSSSALHLPTELLNFKTTPPSVASASSLPKTPQ